MKRTNDRARSFPVSILGGSMIDSHLIYSTQYSLVFPCFTIINHLISYFYYPPYRKLCHLRIR